MDNQQPAPSFDESVAQVMKTLPPVIRAYLAEGKYTPVAKALMTKYSLRIDQGGVLEREIMLLLMGIETPDEFTKALAEEARLSKEVIDGIVQDVNSQIFVPIREQIRSETTVAPEPPKLIPQTPIAPVATRVPQQQSPLAAAIAAATASPKVMQGIAKAPNSVKLLEDHEEPHIEFTKAAPPANLPGALPPPALPRKPAPVTSYSTDPYREPIDEKSL